MDRFIRKRYHCLRPHSQHKRRLIITEALNETLLWSPTKIKNKPAWIKLILTEYFSQDTLKLDSFLKLRDSLGKKHNSSLKNILSLILRHHGRIVILLIRICVLLRRKMSLLWRNFSLFRSTLFLYTRKRIPVLQSKFLCKSTRFINSRILRDECSSPRSLLRLYWEWSVERKFVFQFKNHSLCKNSLTKKEQNRTYASFGNLTVTRY